MSETTTTTTTEDVERPTRVISLRVRPDRRTLLEAWAERNGLTLSAAADCLLGTALRFEDADLAAIPDLAREVEELRTANASVQRQLLRLESLVGAVGELAAVAPLLLAYWQASELGRRAADETPEQAEERIWQLWTEAGRVEWDARRRRTAPTDDELELALGGASDSDDEEQAGDGVPPSPGAEAEHATPAHEDDLAATPPDVAATAPTPTAHDDDDFGF